MTLFLLRKWVEKRDRFVTIDSLSGWSHPQHLLWWQNTGIRVE
ncbi:MAG: hypothetical protein P8K08_16345 [Fuerstiella sp.]|nr:hypothetical protein [Fuerstiella sp.]